MPATTKLQIPKARVDRSKLPRPSIGPPPIQKKTSIGSRVAVRQPVISAQEARMGLQAVAKNEIAAKVQNQPRPSLISSAQPRKSILINRNPVAPAKENVYAHNRAKLLEETRRSGIMPPPRKSILAPVGSSLRLQPPSIGGQGNRLSQIGLKPPVGNRLSIMQQQFASGPIPFEVDETATRSILTNQGISEDAAARAGSLVAAPRPSMYASRRRQSMANTAPIGMEEVARAFARQAQVSMGLQADRESSVQVPTGDGVAKAKTPARLSMYRRQSTSKFFGTSTPISARKLEHPRNVGGMASNKADYLTLPPQVPLPSLDFGEDHERVPTSAANDRAIASVLSQNTPSIQIIPETPPKAPTFDAEMEGSIAEIINAKCLLAVPKNAARLPVNGRSPARVPRVQMKGTIGKSPMRSAALSRYSRRTTMEFEEIYANFSPNRLRNELEAVRKQEKAIVKLLEAATCGARSKAALVEHPAATGLATIVEGKERESTSPRSKSGSNSTMPKLEEEEEDDEISASPLPSTSGPSKQLQTLDEESENAPSTSVRSVQALSEEDEESESDDEVVIPAKIQARRNADCGDGDDKPSRAFGMRLRPRNRK